MTEEERQILGEKDYESVSGGETEAERKAAIIARLKKQGAVNVFGGEVVRGQSYDAPYEPYMTREPAAATATPVEEISTPVEEPEEQAPARPLVRQYGANFDNWLKGKFLPPQGM